MKTFLNKTQAKEKIDNFFKQSKFTKEEMKKIKRLAMKFKIRIGSYKKSYCKACLSQLKGITRVNKSYKSIICSTCGFMNRFKI